MISLELALKFVVNLLILNILSTLLIDFASTMAKRDTSILAILSL